MLLNGGDVTERGEVLRAALEPVRGSRLWQAVSKLEWADAQFIGALGMVNEYIDTKQAGVREERDERGHRYILFANPLQKRIPILVGSGVHALRSALDTAVGILIEGVSGKNMDRVGFPFAEREGDLRASFEKSVNKCGNCGHIHEQNARQKRILDYLPELKDVILEDIRPWKEGNKPLWSLNKLDNFQKHRALLLAFTATRATMNFFTPEGYHSIHNEWIVWPGNEMIIAESRTSVIPESEPVVQIVPTLPDDLPYGGEPLFDVLGDMFRATHSVIMKLYQKFEGNKALTGE